MMNEDRRWRQRFLNFNRAFGLLRKIFEILEQGNILQLDAIVKEGIIQRFQFTFELGRL